MMIKVVRNRKASYAKGMLRKYRRGLNVKALSTGRFALNGFTADLPDEPFLSIPIV